MNLDILKIDPALKALFEGFEVRVVPKAATLIEPSALQKSEIFSERLKQLIELRRAREKLFGADLFADPAWDMMLDLCLAAELGISVSVSSLCIASASPSTTALRWIKLMEERGMIVRNDDRRDRRRVFVSLQSDVRQRLRTLLDDWFATLASPSPVLIWSPTNAAR
jgi:hypothetical protein